MYLCSFHKSCTDGHTPVGLSVIDGDVLVSIDVCQRDCDSTRATDLDVT